MIFVRLTRLRIRSVRFLPDRDWAFWTLTSWNGRDDMRRYMTTGAHKSAMPHLMHWCDEASVAHWEQEEMTLPSWEDADRRMRQIGRASKVHNPSPEHESMNYRPPKASSGAAI